MADEGREKANTAGGAPGDAGTEAFLSRWSRLKRETRQLPPEKALDTATNSKAPALEPLPLEKLGFDSDYRAFFDSKVDEETRRAALKKLFSDPRFNVMDGLDVYIDDYSKGEPIPAAMLAQLKQAQEILEWAKGDKEKAQESAGPGARAAAEPVGAEAGEPAALKNPPAETIPSREPPNTYADLRRLRGGRADRSRTNRRARKRDSRLNAT